MDALSLHSKILDGYKDYIQSFIDIHDDDIREKVEESLRTHNHGGDWSEWPAKLRVREFPAYFRNYRGKASKGKLVSGVRP